MRKQRLLRMFIAAFTVSALVTGTCAIQSNAAENQNMVPLTDINGKSILMRGNPISIPDQPIHEKRQFRSSWVSTVNNIDIPQGLTEEQFKAKYLEILKNFENLNMNAVTFQVRPMNDAFYKSDLNPWSEYLTGIQGKDPGFDPLEWMINQTHKRNMEFHAWFNPYRVSQGVNVLNSNSKEEILNKLADGNFAKKHPEYVMKFDSKLILDPGIPQVQEFVEDSIMEVVKKYDIDAVHFDDYFYPYKVTRKGVTSCFGDKNEDKSTFDKYKGNIKDIKDWRRNNIDTLINDISKKIKKEKPYVKFGVSPFGIWGHLQNHPVSSSEGAGSDTAVTSSSSYDDIYADTRKWVKEGWIDYITPQIYWYFNQIPTAPYGELASWWSDVVKGTNCQLYIGQASYKVTSPVTHKTGNDDGYGVYWEKCEEIPNQLKFNSMYPEIQGSSFFSLTDLNFNVNGVTDIIKNQYFNTKALVPTMPWLGTSSPKAINELTIKQSENNGVDLSWEDSISNDSTYYVIYRFDDNSKIDLENPYNIVAKVRRAGNQIEIKYTDATADKNKKYTYAVTAVNRLNNESKEEFSYYSNTK